MENDLETVRQILEKLAKLGNGAEYGNSIGNLLAQEALVVIEGLLAKQQSQPHPPRRSYPRHQYHAGVCVKCGEPFRLGGKTRKPCIREER